MTAKKYGDLQEPELFNITKGEGAGVDIRVSGLKNPANVEQLVKAMQTRYGIIRSIRRNKISAKMTSCWLQMEHSLSEEQQ